MTFHASPAGRLAEERAMHAEEDRIDETRVARMRAMTAYLLLFTGVDLGLTLTLMATTDFHESNPIARHLVASVGLFGLAIYKLATASVAIGILHAFRRRPEAELGAWLMTALVTGVFGVWFEYLRVAPLTAT